MVQELQPGDPEFIGPYRLLGQLGSGGMGRVYLGISAGGRRVAVKVIRPELAANPEFRARFRREVAAARTVNAIFTAVVADADVDAPAPWLATAYVAGPSLAEAVREHGPLPADSVRALAAGLAESLTAIHAAGLVHRDLKPSNILLAEDGPRVIDFGISRTAEATSLTSTGLVVGSAGFMSPEQAEGGVVGSPSDMFSLGAVLAFAATGKGPFGSGSTAALVFRVVYGSPDLDQVPAQLRPLIERCLAKAPGDRPTAADFLAQIGPVRLVTGWLPEAVLHTASDPEVRAAVKDSRPTAIPPDTGETLVSGGHPPSPPAAAGPPQSGPGPVLRKRRFRRRPALAWAAGVLLAVSAATALVLNSVNSRSQAGSPSPAVLASEHSASGTTSPSAARPSATQTASPYRFQLAGARPYSCSGEGSLYSAPSTSKVLFTFVNNTGVSVQITWLDFNGNRQVYDMLSSGSAFNVDTYIGHYWLIAGSGGGCLGIFGISGSGHIVITLS